MATKYRGDKREERALTTFIRLTRSVDAVMERTFDQAPLPEGITLTQFGVMEALLHLGPQCQIELGKKLLKTKGNISMVVDQLTRAGLVGRRRNREDRRFQEVYLTPAGSELIGTYFPRYARALTDEFAVLSAEEQERLGRLCRRLGMKER
ncbi:MAG: MarR family winged helix-turn-helix transcriptional regulator [Alkalispirochaetaceae bacterium]